MQHCSENCNSVSFPWIFTAILSCAHKPCGPTEGEEVHGPVHLMHAPLPHQPLPCTQNKAVVPWTEKFGLVQVPSRRTALISEPRFVQLLNKQSCHVFSSVHERRTPSTGRGEHTALALLAHTLSLSAVSKELCGETRLIFCSLHLGRSAPALEATGQCHLANTCVCQWENGACTNCDTLGACDGRREHWEL